MKRALLALALMSTFALPALPATQVVVVSGLGGEAAFEKRFETWSTDIAERAGTAAGSADNVTRLTGDAVRVEAIDAAMRTAASKLAAGDTFMLVLLGHGSFDGNDYRFNIPGPDVTGTQLGAWLDRIPASIPQLIVNATSASGGLAEKWAKPNRIVITATKSFGERNATKFGEFWAEALGSEEADRDKDGNITALEAYDFANRRVADTFKADVAIATEHSQISGKEPARFVVARLGKSGQFGSDAQLMALRQQQSQLEEKLDGVRAQKAQLGEDQYFAQLEPVLVDIARLGAQIDARVASLGGDPNAQAGGNTDARQ
ncbi:MAG: hypothetical protein LBE59_06860 [Nevskiaceae bacterium]|nr:hypothetical protein [Nevskiaceae bacterium]